MTAVTLALLALLFFAESVASQECFIGEVRMFAGSFVPAGWAPCNGQLLQIRENEALFSVIGITYGGDGRQTFGVPDLRGRVPVGAGTGLGLSRVGLGEKLGSETASLEERNLAAHQHEATPDLSTAEVADIPISLSGLTAETTVDLSGVTTMEKKVMLAPQTCPVSGGSLANVDAAAFDVSIDTKLLSTPTRRRCRKRDTSCVKAVRTNLVKISKTSELPIDSSGTADLSSLSADVEGGEAMCEAQKLDIPEIGLKGTATATTTVSGGADTTATIPEGSVTGTVKISSTGAGAPVDVRDPSLGINFIICLVGIFPSRN